MQRCQFCGNPTLKVYLLDDLEVCKICYDEAMNLADGDKDESEKPV